MESVIPERERVEFNIDRLSQSELTRIRRFACGDERIEFGVLLEIGHVALADFGRFQASSIDAMLEKFDVVTQLVSQGGLVAFAQHRRWMLTWTGGLWIVGEQADCHGHEIVSGRVRESCRRRRIRC